MIGARRPVRAVAARRRAGGFTLVEVLIALLLMALLTGMAWQALDGMLRARDASREVIDRTSRLATVLVQWQQDLQSIVDTEQVPPLAFDGQTLRMTVRDAAGVALVAWSVRGGVWQRWTAPPAVRAGELREHWLRSQQLLGNEPGHLTVAEGATQWQLYYSRGGQWSNAQSTGDLGLPPPAAPPVAPPAGPPTAPPGAPPGAPSAAPPGTPPPLRELLPEGVRLVITLGGQTLTRDIALGPG